MFQSHALSACILLFAIKSILGKYDVSHELNAVIIPDNNKDQEIIPSQNEDLPKRRVKRAQSCMLTRNQKQRIRNSECIKSHVKKRSIGNEHAFIENDIMLLDANVYPQTPVQKLLSRSRRFIVNGREANPHEYKFMAALLTEDRSGRLRQFCAGSLIDEYHVLTAAHCVTDYTSDDIRRLRVKLGLHKLNQREGSSTHKVDRVIRHINFNFRNLDYDIAILTLKTPAPIYSNPNIKPVCLLSGSNQLVGEQAIVSGWGTLKFGKQIYPNALQSVDVEVMSNAVCRSRYGPKARHGITSRMMCAALPGKDSCQGDSGGPLVTCSGSNDCTQIGLVSWGIGCGKTEYPGVYARVNEMIHWIQGITSCY